MTLLAVHWPSFLLITAGTLVALYAVSMAVKIAGWLHLRCRKVPMPLRDYLNLRKLHLPIGPIAQAFKASVALGRPTPAGVWASFAILGIDVSQIAAALAMAVRNRLDTSAAHLGAAALAGYDPVEVVQAARHRGLSAFTKENLNELEAWGLTPHDLTDGL